MLRNCLNIFVCNPPVNKLEATVTRNHTITYYLLKKQSHFQYLKKNKKTSLSQQVFANKKVYLHNRELIMCWVNHFLYYMIIYLPLSNTFLPWANWSWRHPPLVGSNFLSLQQMFAHKRRLRKPNKVLIKTKRWQLLSPVPSLVMQRN